MKLKKFFEKKLLKHKKKIWFEEYTLEEFFFQIYKMLCNNSEEKSEEL